MEETVGVADMILLDPLTEGQLLKNLQDRFKESHVYTYIGDVVVSVNPYKTLNIYSREYINEYRTKSSFELPPHVFSLADDAYCSLRDFNLDQCIIISGESGSGKTEASKIVMRYVAAVSGKGERVDHVKEQLLNSNPVLEAFGNAKTIRNDNSSRFGKYMDLEFDFKGDPIGGVISNYLLEKSRVVHQAPGERSFHIFYYLLMGGSDNVLSSLGLVRNFSNYNYLNQSGCVSVPTIDDVRMFAAIETAMKRIGFLQDEISAVYRLIGAILHLGNIEFADAFKSGMDTVMVSNEQDAEMAALLLGCGQDLLLDMLSTRTVHSGQDKVTTTLSKANALYGRDALCKAIYSRLFSWIVERTNDRIRAPKRSYGKKVIGVLDIYGFEVFENNAFEQFIINFCNEKLQQLFIELTLKLEQEEYVREGVEWIHIDYFNNAIICDLIEKPQTGILAHLDELCLMPGKITDLNLLEKLDKNCGSHPHYDSRGKTRSDTTIGFECFKLKHFAGDVTYKVEGFIDKNNDLLFRDMSQGMYICEHPLLKEMFPEGNPSNLDKKRPPTVSVQMKLSLAKLVQNLMSKRPHYIRCIKPNDSKSPGIFQDGVVRHQARYLGLLENIRVRRAGYCYRQLYEYVLQRYKMLCLETWPNYRGGDAKSGVAEIMKVLRISTPECEYGRTKLFLRNPRTVFFLENERRAKLFYLVILMQKVVRGWLCKHKFQKMRAGQIKIAATFKKYRQRKKFLTIRNATITIQAYARGMLDRQVYQKKLRKFAGPKIFKFVKQSLAVRFLIMLHNNLPSLSPLDRNWPKCSPLFEPSSKLLYSLYHAWRCRKYRHGLSEARKKILTEKLKASELFKGKKSVYPHSVAVPFEDDHINLEQTAAWQKAQVKLPNLNIHMADYIVKVHRSNAKEITKVIILGDSEILILHPKSFAMLYRLEYGVLNAISISPYKDGVVAFHVKEDRSNKAVAKGDFVISTERAIELVTKAVLLHRRCVGTDLPVSITRTFTVNFKGKPVEMNMKPDVELSRPSFKKRGNRIEVGVTGAEDGPVQ